MTDDDLSRKVRQSYSNAMEARRTTEQAIRECLSIVQQHRPDRYGPEARKLIARMIAEEPLGSSQPSRTR